MIKRVLNRTFYYGLGSILSRIIGFAMLPIYTTYLSPADYGVAGFLVLYVAVSQIVLGARLENAVSKFVFDSELNQPLGHIFTTGATISVVASIFPAIVGVIFSEQLSLLFFKNSSYLLPVAVASISIVASMAESYGLLYIKIKDKPKLFLLLSTLKLFIQLAINILVIVIYQKGVIGVIVSSVISSIAITIITTVIFLRTTPFIKFDKELVRPFFAFSWPLWIAGFLALYTSSVHQVFIIHFKDLEILGLFNLANTFGALVVTLIWAPFLKFWETERFRIHDRENSQGIYKVTFYSMAGLTFFMAFGIAVFSGPVIVLMADISFHTAVIAVPPLAMFYVLQNLVYYANFSFMISNKSNEIAKNGVIEALALSVAYAFAIPTFGLLGAAYSMLTIQLAYLHYVIHKGNQIYSLGIRPWPINLMVLFALAAYYLLDFALPLSSEPILDIAKRASLITAAILVIALCFAFMLPKHLTQVKELIANLKSIQSKPKA